MQVRPPAFSTSASDAVMSAGIWSVQPITVPKPRSSSSARSFSSRPHTVMGWNSPDFADRFDGRDARRRRPTSRPRRAPRGRPGSRPRLLRIAVTVVLGDAEPLADEGPVRVGVLAATRGWRAGGRDLAHREVAVDAAVHPERVDREVGEVGERRGPGAASSVASARARATRAGTPTRSRRGGTP